VTAILLALTLLLPPLTALALAAYPRARPLLVGMAPWLAAPALALALLWTPDALLVLPWMLLDARLGLDQTGRVFLLFTSVLWLAAGVYGRSYLAHDEMRHRFFLFFLLTMTGNFGLILAQDIVTFYTFFALMTFSAYGLVVHDGTAFARRAGAVYIVLAIIGEFLMLVGLLLAATAAGGVALALVGPALAEFPGRGLAVPLILAGFGVKAGALLLHVWLPLAHPAAPTPASAVLSGAMIKAGLLGWLRFLPLGYTNLTDWGALVVVMGLLAAFYGVAVGVTQSNPKANLAYSSISQMGIITVGIGIGLMEPAAWPLALTAVLVYALHHGLAKGALFLGVGMGTAVFNSPWQRRLVLAGLALAALSLAGAPLTSGAVAKVALKDAILLGPSAWYIWLDWLLPVAAAGTTLLMFRFMYLMWRSAPSTDTHHATPGLWLPWSVVLAGVIAAAWIVPVFYGVDVVYRGVFGGAALWAAVWPLVLGAGLGIAVWRLRASGPVRWVGEIPPGDVVVPVDLWVRRLASAGRRLSAGFSARTARYRSQAARGIPLREPQQLERLEQRLSGWSAAGVLLVAVAVALIVLLSWPAAVNWPGGGS
jgi:formate hydrogenlyase subunit 3/multisubunit Na+/H+ antiporter MnhD subunit